MSSKTKGDFKDDCLVIVTWGDAFANLGYYETDHDHTPMVMKDIGWLAEENDETIVLVRSLCENGSRRNQSIIPLVNVIDIEEIYFE